ncbi:sulfatase-like hydrolase/transferase [Haloferula sp.]|uniref:sulfatase-like hydrolase/transferase n=1 Tax=Haloferula sp. TaxID=2497595 RepID=UPI00329D2E9A
MRLLLLLLAATFPALGASEGKPNILLLLSDDQSWNGLSVAMHPEISVSKSSFVQTPHLATLASKGMRFSHAYSPAPVCSPTRISLQTGMTNARLRWTKAAPNLSPTAGYALIAPSHRKDLRSDETTIAEVLRSAGYATAHFGKWHIGGGGPESHGYDASDGDNGNEVSGRFAGDNPVDIVGMGERANAFMKKSKEAGKPFFIQMSYHALHSPGNANPKTIAKYQKLMPDAPERSVQRAAIADDLDTGVGKLLDDLEALDLADTTWVIYTSDNGGGGGGRSRGGERGLQGGKGSLGEGGIRVPLIIRGPDIPADSWCHQQVVGYDFFPTFCELAGVTSLPADLDGESIVAQVQGSSAPIERASTGLVFHFPHYQGKTPHSAIYVDDFKLIKFYETGKLELFDIRKDTLEATDLSARMPEKAKELERLLDAYLKDVKADLPTPNPQAIDGKSYDPRSAKTAQPGGSKRARGAKRR